MVADEIAFDLINQGMAEGLIQNGEVATQMGPIEQLICVPRAFPVVRLAMPWRLRLTHVLIMDDSQMDPLGRRQFFQWLAHVVQTTVFIVTRKLTVQQSPTLCGCCTRVNGSPGQAG